LLAELYQLLSPAVPMVETPSASGGSGFLIRHNDRYLVVTNRHVIAYARNGLEVYFLRSINPGQEERLKIPSAKVKLVAVHRALDLALIDISAAAEELAAWKIQPHNLAAKDHIVSVGEHVFAIGHPGDATGGVLTRTLSDGIVSAINRKPGFNRVGYTQVTVPINPGNTQVTVPINRKPGFNRVSYTQVTVPNNPGNSANP
jgi:S1-C subfamily serine protease